jgi:hypothetical protein
MVLLFRVISWIVLAAWEDNKPNQDTNRNYSYENCLEDNQVGRDHHRVPLHPIAVQEAGEN